MKAFAVVAMLALCAAAAPGFVSPAHADGTCTANAADKHLAGAAKTSFLKKCQKDATATCSSAADDKKLHGAARTSFTKKCVSDAVGSGLTAAWGPSRLPRRLSAHAAGPLALSGQNFPLVRVSPAMGRLPLAEWAG